MTEIAIPEKRRLIPKEFTIAFKQLFRGLEVHAVLGERVLVDEVEPFTEQDAVNERLAKEGGGKAIYSPEQYYTEHGMRKVVEKPKACVGIIIQSGDGVTEQMRARGLVEDAAVCFGPYAGTEYFIGGAKFRILDVKEVLAVLRATEGHDLDEVIGPVKV